MSDGTKRKQSGTPASTEPAGKHVLYVKTAGKAVGGEAPKPPAQILSVHSNNNRMGEIAEGYFNQVISKCFAIKVASVLAGEKELAWTPEMQALPSYDKAHSRGKITCLNKQTLDFWVKYIPIN